MDTKTLVLSAASLLSISLTGCGGGSRSGAQPTAPAATSGQANCSSSGSSAQANCSSTSNGQASCNSAGTTATAQPGAQASCGSASCGSNGSNGQPGNSPR